MIIIWQDIVLMITGFAFSIALIPTIKAKEKPTKSTCLITAICLTINAICLATLNLWLAFSSVVLSDIAWWILLFQRRSI